jgi:Cu2+-exporting ATPase
LIVEIDGIAAGRIEFRRSSRLEAAPELRRLRSLARAPIAIVSTDSDPCGPARAKELGADSFQGGLGPDDLAQFLDLCHERGLRTAFVGDCRRQPRAAAEADMAIALGVDADPDAESAAVVVFQPRLELVADLWEIARSHTGRVQSTQRFILVPNLLCVAGAFFFGATALTSVVVSSLGTLGLYSRSLGALQALETPGRRRRPPGV